MNSFSKQTNAGGKALNFLAFAVVFGVVSVANAQTIRATVDGVRVNFPEAQPIMINNHVMVPVRGVFEHMNASVDWYETSQTVVAQRGNDNIRLSIASRTAMVNGREIMMDTPAMVYRGSTMVPLRFISESLGATVDWQQETSTVEINTMTVNQNPTRQRESNYTETTIEAGTVIPFRIIQTLTSNNSRNGDKFRARIDTDRNTQYSGLPSGTILEGHVDARRARDNKLPGVLGLAFDRIRLPNGDSIRIYGALIGMDTNSVENRDGKWISRPDQRDDELKYVGYGAGAGVLASVVTHGNLLTDTVIGSALGALFGSTQQQRQETRNITIEAGSRFGVRLKRDLTFRTMRMEDPK